MRRAPTILFLLLAAAAGAAAPSTEGTLASPLSLGGRTLQLVSAHGENRNGLARLDSARNRVAAVTPLPPGQLTTAYGGGSLWVSHVNDSLLEQIDPRSGMVVGRLQTRVGVALAVAGGSLWTIFRDGTPQRRAIR